MLMLPILAAIGASFGWACGIVLAQRPAQLLGAFEFTRIQLLACSVILALATTMLGYWHSIDWSYWTSFALSSTTGILLGNLAMIGCLRIGGPSRCELLLSLKAPLVSIMAYVFWAETPSLLDGLGGIVVMAGIALAILYGRNANANTPAKSDQMHGSIWALLALGILAPLCQGFGFLIMKPVLLQGAEPIAISAIRLLGAAFIISVMAICLTQIPTSNAMANKAKANKVDLDLPLLGQTILPGFIGYGISSTLLLYAFANFDVGLAAVLGSLSPVLVLFILWVKEGQPPRKGGLFGAVLSVLGTGIIIVF